jgi:coenzyme Q-binding protein COQ10
MPSFRTKRRVPFTPQQMFALVADVERYPEFVPLCEGLRVKSRKAEGDKQLIVAQMDVGYGAIRESFTSQVTLDPAQSLVTVTYIDGPFSHLENRWTFEPAASGCDVDFFISYELKSTLLQIMVGAVFEKAFRRFTEAFEARAHQVYGTPGPDRLNPA